MNADGRRFGFGWVHQLLHSDLSATEVASAAKDFRQADDISVISVTRMAELDSAAA